MEHLQLRIKSIKQETLDSKSYYVQEINSKPIGYKAGQFLTLIIHLHNNEIRRSYSISSTPGVDEDIFFTVKKVENGEVSRFLLDTLAVNDTITTLPPTGRFIITEPVSDNHVFIVAGTGITPVFSLIKHLLYNYSEPKILLIYQNRNEEDTIFRKELVNLQEKFQQRISVKLIYSQPIDPTIFPKRLNNNLLEKMLEVSHNSHSTLFYLCGPDPFMRMAQFTLKVMGFGSDVIKKENFFCNRSSSTFHYRHNTSSSRYYLSKQNLPVRGCLPAEYIGSGSKE